MHFDHNYCRTANITITDQFIQENIVYNQETLNDHPISNNQLLMHEEISANNQEDLYEYAIQIEENYLGEMNVKCMHCGAYHFKDERVDNNKYAAIILSMTVAVIMEM